MLSPLNAFLASNSTPTLAKIACFTTEYNSSARLSIIENQPLRGCERPCADIYPWFLPPRLQTKNPRTEEIGLSVRGFRVMKVIVYLKLLHIFGSKGNKAYSNAGTQSEPVFLLFGSKGVRITPEDKSSYFTRTLRTVPLEYLTILTPRCRERWRAPLMP